MSENPESMTNLDHEHRNIYAAAVALDGLVAGLTRCSPRGNAWLADQSQRASARVVLNHAEALGREGADRARMLHVSHAAPQRAPVHFAHGRGASGSRRIPRWNSTQP